MCMLHQLGIDVIYDQGRQYLIDCGPTQFSIRHLQRQQDAGSIVDHLKALFCKHSPPTEILGDNDMAFHSKAFRDFLNEWQI